MNDLVDLQWEDSSSRAQTARSTSASNYSSLRPTSPNISRQSTPISAAASGRSTPLSAVNALGRSGPGDGTATNKTMGGDSFSNLLPAKKTTQLSMQERQKQLIEERARQAAEQQKRHNEQFHADDAQFWEGFGKGSGRNTPASNGQSKNNNQILSTNEDEEDILAAFNASAPVDASSHFPPPTGSTHSINSGSSTGAAPSIHTQSLPVDDDDDPFGLGHMSESHKGSRPPKQPSTTQIAAPDDDDILGALGKPVSEPVSSRDVSPLPGAKSRPKMAPDDGIRDRAIAELVDMGFSAERSQEALAHTSSGLDVQAAVSWLLNNAHQESKAKARQSEHISGEMPVNQAQDVLSESRDEWRQRKSQTPRNDTRTPTDGERDATERASEISISFFKSANSFWQSGQKKMQKALAEFQQRSDTNQPRWMNPNAAASDETTAQSQSERMTDEAMMMNLQRPASQQHQPRNRSQAQDVETAAGPLPRRTYASTNGQPHDLPPRPAQKPAQKLSRQAVEEQSANAYVSPSRRRKPQTQTPVPSDAPTPEPSRPVQPEPELDIFNPSSTVQTQTAPNNRAMPSSVPRKGTSSVATTAPPRPKPSARPIPSVSPSSMSQSNAHRMEGTAAFKRGDYGAAHASYTSAIAPLPQRHPVLIILHSNRALTSLKIGDPKAAITDADAALELVGPSQGEGEIISLGGGEADKPMKEFYGKALMRKAEALEHLEKWNDAAQIWREAVENGVGGSISIQGRNRCEAAAGKATAPARTASGPPSSSTNTKAPKKPAAPKPKPRSAAADLAGPGAKESEAVSRLRAANAAAAAASDEAFALSDSVEAKLNTWKAGKEGNLRALLASLDTVLWEGASWTKVSMGDLVMPNRCKVVYMKAIGKCHPDKIPPDASVEQRMISGSVFATLNEAWDRFKADNGL